MLKFLNQKLKQLIQKSKQAEIIKPSTNEKLNNIKLINAISLGESMHSFNSNVPSIIIEIIAYDFTYLNVTRNWLLIGFKRKK